MIIAAVAFSVCPLLYTISIEHTDPLTQSLFVQIAIVFVAGIILTLTLGSPSKLKLSLSELFHMPVKSWLIILVSGVTAYLGTLFFLLSINLMSPAGAAIIMETWPILAIFVAPLLIEKKWVKFRLLDFALIFLMTLGLIMISAGETGLSLKQFMASPLFLFEGNSYEEMFGILCAFLSAFCYAWAGVSRPQFVNALPKSYRIKHFQGIETWKESLFAFWITAFAALPLALITSLIFGLDLTPLADIATISLGLGFALTAMGCFYALSLTVSNTSSINLIWYISPILAALWLALFGYSEITEMLIAGGFLIIVANVVLIVTSTRGKQS